MSETGVSRSVNPPAASGKKASRQVTRAATRKRSWQAARCNAITSRCHVTLGDPERAVYRSFVSEDEAVKSGARKSAYAAVNEWIDVATGLIKAVVAGKVAGFGLVRMRYAAELADEVVKLSEAEAPASEPTGGGTPSSESGLGARKLQRQVVRALRNLGFEVTNIPLGSAGPAVSRHFEALAEKVQDAMARFPATILSDAGLTAKVVESLSDAAHARATSHVVATEARADAGVRSRLEDALIGRLLRETRLLAASGRDSQKDDANVPVTRAKRSKRRAKAAKPAPTPPPVT